MLENSKIEKEKAFLMFQKELNNSHDTYRVRRYRPKHNAI